jgi:hypothetical protein
VYAKVYGDVDPPEGSREAEARTRGKNSKTGNSLSDYAKTFNT